MLSALRSQLRFPPPVCFLPVERQTVSPVRSALAQRPPHQEAVLLDSVHLFSGAQPPVLRYEVVVDRWGYNVGRALYSHCRVMCRGAESVPSAGRTQNANEQGRANGSARFLFWYFLTLVTLKKHLDSVSVVGWQAWDESDETTDTEAKCLCSSHDPPAANGLICSSLNRIIQVASIVKTQNGIYSITTNSLIFQNGIPSSSAVIRLTSDTASVSLYTM